MRRRAVLLGTLIAVLVAATSAFAAQRTGGPGPDHLVGTAGADRLVGRGGNDRLDGRAGRDQLFGGAGADLLAGDRGNDRLVGARGRDTLIGGAGRDRINAAGRRGDRDVGVGGGGDDVIRSRDGAVDQITCGRGRDTVIADGRDQVAGDCERVVRG